MASHETIPDDHIMDESINDGEKGSEAESNLDEETASPIKRDEGDEDDAPPSSPLTCDTPSSLKGEEEGGPVEGDHPISDDDVDEDDDDDNEHEAASSVNMFEPEISIESDEDDLQCSLNDDDASDENEGELKEASSPFDHYNDIYDDPDYDNSDEDFVLRNNSSKNNNREKKYECPICGKFFMTSSAMNGHVAKGHGTTLGLKFTCHVCGAAGSSRASLKRHLIRTHKIKNVDHPELLTKKCTHCSIGFSSHLLLYEHIRSDHSENLNEYHNCSWCPALMRAKASLLRHIRRTHPGKEEPIASTEKCPICEDAFPSRHLLQRHLKSSHPNQPRHVCSICNAGFKFPYMLSRHKISHEDPKKFEETRRKRKYSVGCEFCGRKFGSKPRLEYHVEVVHTNPPIKIYTCRLCGLTFPTAKQNNRHYRKVHRPERQKIHCGKCNITFETQEECSQHRALHPNTCEICQKQFLRRDSLREHLLIHSAPRHQCPHCTKKFTQRSNLKRHIRVHTGEKPYKCTYCSRCFSDKSACNSHIRVHTGYERSVCNICGASFSKKQRLNYHMRMHTGEGLLYCPLCMRPSTNSYSLRKHIESHQQPLTKALESLGFKPLLVSDPNFVMRALQAMTQATLQNISRHENIPNSFIDEHDHQMSNGRDLLSVASSTDEHDIDECSKSLTTIAKIEGELSDEASLDLSSNNDVSIGNECEEESKFSLTKFLQSLLEKESQKVRTDRRDRRNRKLRCRGSIRGVDYVDDERGALVGDEERDSEEEDEEEEEEEDEEEEELPSTIGDELVKQCLEIIMKDEPQTDDEEYDDNGSYTGSTTPIKMECDQIIIKTEPHNQYDFQTQDQQQQQQKVNLKKAIHSSKPSKGIPKIKISRITKTDTDSTRDIFVAEIVKKK